MMAIQIYRIFLFTTLFYCSQAILLLPFCKEPWVLQNKNEDSDGTVAFKNITTPGKRQSLSWIWSGNNAESWEARITDYFNEGVKEGSLVYRSTRHGEKTHVHITWKLVGNDFSSVNGYKKIFNKSWSITTRDGIAMEFNSDKYGNWKFTVLGKYTITNNEISQTASLADDILSDPPMDKHIIHSLIHPRKRRAELEPETEIGNTQGNETILQAGVMDCIYDYFFGEGDGVTGRSVGVFIKMKNWVKNLACRIRGDCQEPEYTTHISPNFPPMPMPPSNPDAEPITPKPTSADNDI